MITTATDNNAIQRFAGFTSNYPGFSGSVGASYQVNEYWNTKLNISKGFRAPAINELSSNGVHEGTIRYEIGNSKLKAENSLQIDGELSAGWHYLSMTFNGYYNFISNYIYQRNVNGETIIKDGNTYHVYRFVQGNSVLQGFELEIDIHPVDQLHFDNSLDYVAGTNKSTGIPLPYIPALHSVHKIRWTFSTPKLSVVMSPYIEIGGQVHFAQKRIDTFETETPGYFLLDASAGTKLRVGGQTWTLFVAGNNLTNTSYYDHLSRLKEMGIRNPGWGLTIGFIAPFGIYEKK